MKQEKMKPYTEAWERSANNLARSYCPNIYPCGDCGYPVIRGYCCTSCQSSDPSEAYREARKKA